MCGTHVGTRFGVFFLRAQVDDGLCRCAVFCGHCAVSDVSSDRASKGKAQAHKQSTIDEGQ